MFLQSNILSICEFMMWEEVIKSEPKVKREYKEGRNKILADTSFQKAIANIVRKNKLPLSVTATVLGIPIGKIRKWFYQYSNI